MSERGGGCGASPRAPLDPPGLPPGSLGAPRPGGAGAGQERQGRGFPASWLGGGHTQPLASPELPSVGRGEKREEKIKIKT